MVAVILLNDEILPSELWCILNTLSPPVHSPVSAFSTAALTECQGDYSTESPGHNSSSTIVGRWEGFLWVISCSVFLHTVHLSSFLMDFEWFFITLFFPNSVSFFLDMSHEPHTQESSWLPVQLQRDFSWPHSHPRVLCFSNTWGQMCSWYIWLLPDIN